MLLSLCAGERELLSLEPDLRAATSAIVYSQLQIPINIILKPSLQSLRSQLCNLCTNEQRALQPGRAFFSEDCRCGARFRARRGRSAHACDGASDQLFGSSELMSGATISLSLCGFEHLHIMKKPSLAGYSAEFQSGPEIWFNSREGKGQHMGQPRMI